VLLFALVAFVLTCRKWNNPLDPTGNRAPATPSHPAPDSAATGRDTGLVLAWQSQDPDSGDTVWFDIYFGKTTPPALLRDSWLDTTFRPSSVIHVEWEKQYFWQVLARDNHGDTSRGPVWGFTTAAVNRVPRVPSAPRPDSGATGLPLQPILSWQGGDPDSGNRVTYDVYFGTSDSPPRVAQALRDSSYAPGRLKPDSVYRWRVTAKDNHGAESPGPLWQFRTATRLNVTAPAAGERLRMLSLDTIVWTGGPGDKPAVSCGLKSKVQSPKSKVRSPEPSAVSDLAASDSTVIFRSTDDGLSWTRVGKAVSLRQFVWQVPGPATALARVQVLAYMSGDTMAGVSGQFRVYDTAPPSPITVTSPTDTSRWVIGTVRDVRWTGGTDGMDSTVVYFSADSGVTWSRQGLAQTPGFYQWTVVGPATTRALIEVRAYNLSAVTTGTSGGFSVVTPPPPTPISVTSPTDTSRWVIGSAHDVTWTGGTDQVDSTVVYYSSNNGMTWTRQGKAEPGSPGVFPWVVPGPATTQARVEVRAYNVAGVTTGTSSPFRITEPPYPDTVVAVVTTGTRPRALCWDSLDDRVFVANYSDSSVSVIDGLADSVIATIRVGRYPSAILGRPGGSTVYVSSEADDHVKVIQGSDLQVIATIMTGQKPVALCWNHTSSKLYTVNNRDSSVSVIDAESNQVVATVPVRGSPSALYWNPLANEVYVANFGATGVSVIDGVTNQLVTTVNTDYAPYAIIGDTFANEVYVAQRNSAKLTVIDGSSHAVVTTIPVGQEPWDLAWSPGSNHLYSANSGSNTVSVIDAGNHSVVTHLPVGTRPRSLLRPGAMDKLYAASYAGDSVAVIDCALNQVLATVPVGAGPIAMCWNRTRAKVYVANYDDGTVSVIGTRSK
jgi:YVTN family beta-propeller protein